MKALVQVFSLDVVSKVLVGLTSILLIHTLVPSEYAIYTFAFAWLTFLSQAFSASVNRLYIVGFRSLSLEHALNAFLVLQVVGLLVLIAASAPLQSHLGGTYAAASALLMMMCLAEFTKTVFQRDQRFWRYSATEIARSSLILTSTAICLKLFGTRTEAHAVFWFQAIGASIVFVIMFRPAPGAFGRDELRATRHIARQVISGQYKYLFAYFSGIALLTQAPVFLLKAYASPLQLASFGSAFRYYALLSLALNAVHAVILPSIQDSRDKEQLDVVFRQVARLCIIFVPIVLLGAFVARWVLPVIDHGRYPDAVTVFRVLAVSSIFSFIFSPHSNIVLKHHDFRYMFFLTLAGLTVQVVSGYILIQRLGAVGAAWSALLAFGLVNGGIFLRARHLRHVVLDPFPDAGTTLEIV